MTAVHAQSGHIQRRPYRVTGEQLVVRRDARELHHTEFHRHVIDELLRFAFRDHAVFQVALDVDVKERRDTAHGHRCAVLCLDRCQISEVQPLERLVRILRRLADVIAVDGGHFLHALERLDLLSELFALTDDIIAHHSASAVCLIFFFLFDQVIDAVQRYAAVIADDAAAAVSIRQSGHDLVAARQTHFRRIGIKHRLIMCLVIFGKDLMQLFAGLIAIGRAGLFRHLDAAIWHERALQRLIGLQAYHLFQILQLFLDVARSISRQRRDDLCLHVEDAALGTLFLLQLLQLAPQLVGRFCRSCQEALITVIRLVVILDKITDIDFFFPDSSVKSFPFFTFDIHVLTRTSVSIIRNPVFRIN